MKNKEPKEIKFSTEKIHKFGISFDEVLSELSQEQRDRIESEARYYIVLRDLRRERKAKGLTQQQLATKVHMPRTMITKIESGSRNVTLDTLMQIAQAMGRELVVGLE